MNVWSGAIALDGESQLAGISLVDRSCNGQCLIPRGSSINYRSFVNPALIPLCARSGPNLELHTTDAQTSQWLKTKFLSAIWLDDEEIETFHTLQCPVGILATVESDNESKKQCSTTVSDVLIYGVLSRAGTTIERPPTPPKSSARNSQDQDVTDTEFSPQQELRIYAAPLSARLLETARSQIPPLRSDSSSGLENSAEIDQDDSFAQFLPDVRSPSPKRKRVAALFEVAAQHHRRVRQRGGGAVSQLMAKSHSQSQSQSFQQLYPLKIKNEVDELTHIPPFPPAAAAVERINSQQRARSMSIGTNNAIHENPADRRITIEHSRPSSSRGLARAPSVKRQTPHSFLDSFESRAPSPFLAPPPDIETSPSSSPKDAESIITQNKNLIVRTILTCMRLWGFNRSKATLSTHRSAAAPASESRLIDLVNDNGKSLPTTSESTISSAGPDEDAFKAMYHATYRASTFALRRYLKENDGLAEISADLPPLLAKERATTVVDDVLRLFCEEN